MPPRSFAKHASTEPIIDLVRAQLDAPALAALRLVSRAARDALVDGRCTRLQLDGYRHEHIWVPLGAAPRLQSLESFHAPFAYTEHPSDCADLAAFVSRLPGSGAALNALTLHFGVTSAGAEPAERLALALSGMACLGSLRLIGGALCLLPALFAPGAAAVRASLWSLSLSGYGRWHDRGVLPSPGGRLPGLPALEKLSIRHIHSSFFDALGPGSLPALRALRLIEEVGTPVHLEPFVAASPLLEDLDVAGNFVPDVARLAGRLRALSALALVVDFDDLDALATDPADDLAAAPLPPLARLSLSVEEWVYEPAELRALLSARWAASLRSLELNDCRPSVLLALAPLQQLRALRLGHVWDFTAAALKPVVAASRAAGAWAPRLVELAIRMTNTNIDAAAVRALLRLPLSRLEYLEIEVGVDRAEWGPLERRCMRALPALEEVAFYPARGATA